MTARYRITPTGVAKVEEDLMATTPDETEDDRRRGELLAQIQGVALLIEHGVRTTLYSADELALTMRELAGAYVGGGFPKLRPNLDLFSDDPVADAQMFARFATLVPQTLRELLDRGHIETV